MNGEHNSGKEQPKHISMELTADGARVTNLKLDGSKLILTIEAQLADSHLVSSGGGQAAVAAAFSPATSSGPAPSSPTGAPERSDTELIARGGGAPAASSPFGQAADPFAPVFADAPADAREANRLRPQEQTKPISLGMGDSAFESPAFAPAPGFGAPQQPQPAPLSLEPLPPMSGDPSADDNAGMFTAPPLEPVRELTDTWDSPFSTGPANTSESARVIKLTDDNLSFSSPAASPEAASMPAPQQPPQAQQQPQPNLWGDISMTPASEPPAPAMEAWDKPLAMSEESSAFGGARHGEPQPAISFGQELQPSPAPQPAAPQPGFGGIPGTPTPGISLGGQPFPEPQPAAPAAPQPLQMPGFGAPAPAPAPAAPGIGFDTPVAGPAAGLSMQQPVAAPAPGLELNPQAQPQNAFGFAPAPAAPAAPAPVPAMTPPPAPAPAPAPMDAAFGFAPMQEEPKPAPAPAPEPQQPAPAQPFEMPRQEERPAAPSVAEEKPKPEAGGTTVLIRYTCPKCKTQGMQAVDKVGTVVNCSNCGKAMRLVMKK